MFFTTEEGEIEIKKGDKVLVKGALVYDKGLMAIKIDGHDNEDIFGNVAIALNYEDDRGIKSETFIIGEVVGFQGVRQVVRFTGTSQRITLNNPNDVLKHSG